MFIVIEYYNSRRNTKLILLNTVTTFEEANNLAKKYACDKYGDEVVNSVEEPYITLDIMTEYTYGDGYEKIVYGVLRLPGY